MLRLCIGRKKYHVESLEAASALWLAEGPDKGLRASQMARNDGNVLDAKGNLVAVISFNGRIWLQGAE